MGSGFPGYMGFGVWGPKKIRIKWKHMQKMKMETVVSLGVVG